MWGGGSERSSAHHALQTVLLAHAHAAAPPRARPCAPAAAARLVGQVWLFLEPECVAEVLDNLGRLVPGRPARDLLLDDPQWLLRAQRGQRWLGEHPDTTMDSIYWSND